MLEDTEELTGCRISCPGTGKTVKGSLFGDCNPTHRHPFDSWAVPDSGDIKLDEITTLPTLDQVNEGYEDLLAGKTRAAWWCTNICQPERRLRSEHQ